MRAGVRPLHALLLSLCLLAPLHVAVAQSRELAAKTEKGNAAMAAGRYDEAAAIYGELARALPDDAGILLNLGMAQSMAGEPRDAVGALEHAVKLQPALHPAWLFLGSAYLETGNAAGAVRPLAKAVETDPRSVKARQMLAESYLRLERYDEAARELRHVIELDEHNANAWYGLGHGHERRARAAFDALRQVGPGSPYESLLIADVLASQGEYEKAVELYRAALGKLPGMRAAHLAIGDIYELAGNAERAATERQKLAALPPPDCVRDMAECAFLEGRYREVIAALGSRKDAASNYWRALAHNELAAQAFSRLEQLPPSPESHAFRAELYRNQGRHLESASELRKAAKLAPGDRRIRRELATSLYLSRDYQAAGPMLRELLAEDAASADLSFMYGDTLLQAQQVEKAVPLLEAALRADPTLVEAHVSLGRAYLQLDRPGDALPHLTAALDTDEDGSLHYQLARAYQATGQDDLAKQMLAKYAEIDKARKRIP